MRRAAAVIVVAIFSACASTSHSQDLADVRAAAMHFLDALNGLDVDAMSACFAEDVTAFVPVAQGDRVNGRAAVTEIFRRFVERTKPTTQRLNIVPEDLTAETSGDLGLVTFNVREPTVTRRRTMVFRRAGERWLILHMHGSDLPVAR